MEQNHSFPVAEPYTASNMLSWLRTYICFKTTEILGKFYAATNLCLHYTTPTTTPELERADAEIKPTCPSIWWEMVQRNTKRSNDIELLKKRDDLQRYKCNTTENSTANKSDFLIKNSVNKGMVPVEGQMSALENQMQSVLQSPGEKNQQHIIFKK